MMTRFSQLTLRNFLIATHDAVATAVALLASFYLRFEGDFFFDRLPLLLRILPWFVALSVIVCYVFNLTTTKWRFISLPDALNILRAASVLTFALLVLDYIFVSPSIHGSYFLGRITIVLYWFLQVFFLSALRFGYRYFRYTRTRHHARTEDASSALLVGRAADAEIVLRGIENGAVKRLWPVGVLSPSSADRGQLIRNIPVLGGVDDIEAVIRDFARREKPIMRVVMMPSAFEPEAHPESVRPPWTRTPPQSPVRYKPRAVPRRKRCAPLPGPSARSRPSSHPSSLPLHRLWCTDGINTAAPGPSSERLKAATSFSRDGEKPPSEGTMASAGGGSTGPTARAFACPSAATP